MVPKVAAKGTSFKGAGLYYLHDKDALTSERVAFTHTENLATTDPEIALKMMAHTAMRQNEIKAAGGSARTGRKLTYSVYSYSLSWAPDEEPSQEQMIEAGQETLKALGLEGHEVLMVAHNDEPHPHIHLIVNRVHPETGKAATHSNDHLNLSRWAESYERRHGKIRCEQRVINNAARRKGRFVKDRNSLGKAAFHRWRRRRGQDAAYVRQATAKNLSAYQSGQRQALHDHHAAQQRDLYDEKEERISRFRAALKEQNRPKWADLYRRQRDEWKTLNKAQKTIYGRLHHHLKQGGADPRARTKTGRKAMVKDAARAVLGQDNPHGELSRKHEAERTALAKESRAQIRDGIRDINKGYRRELGKLKRTQAAERQRLERGQAGDRRTLEAEHSRQSQERARDIREGRDRKQFRKDAGKDLSGEFARRVKERLKATRKRREEERKRGKGEGRERE